MLNRICLAAFVVVASASIAGAADPNGTWNWTLSRNGQEFELSLTLKADGEKLSGSIMLPMGQAIEIKDGTFKNDEVTFSTVFERNGNTMTTRYQGKVEGDAIKGKSERERNGEKMSRDWEAKRQK